MILCEEVSDKYLDVLAEMSYHTFGTLYSRGRGIGTSWQSVLTMQCMSDCSSRGFDIPFVTQRAALMVCGTTGVRRSAHHFQANLSPTVRSCRTITPGLSRPSGRDGYSIKQSPAPLTLRVTDVPRHGWCDAHNPRDVRYLVGKKKQQKSHRISSAIANCGEWIHTLGS